MIFDYFRKKLEQLLETLIAPLWAKLLAASWGVRAAVLLIGSAAAAAAAAPETVLPLFAQLYYLPRVAVAEPAVVPIRAAVARRRHDTVQRLSAIVRADLQDLDLVSVTPWSAAQGALASGGADALDGERLQAYVRKHADPDCGCWSELVNKPGDTRCVFISGWVLSALAMHGRAATPTETGYLLRQQQEAGSWPTFPVHNGPQYGSTYTTAWVLLGLHRQRSRGLVAAQHAVAVDNAVRKGVAWLLSVRGAGARWKPYPGLPNSKASESVSGTVVHALHLLGTASLAPIDAQWLDNLPATPPAADDGENYYVILRSGDGEAIDHFVQIKLPWMLAATVDAFPNGNLLQRARALKWIEAALLHDSVAAADAQANAWWRAELLYALRHGLS